MLSEEAMVGLDKTGLFAPDSRINLATGRDLADRLGQPLFRTKSLKRALARPGSARTRSR